MLLFRTDRRLRMGYSRHEKDHRSIHVLISREAIGHPSQGTLPTTAAPARCQPLLPNLAPASPGPGRTVHRADSMILSPPGSGQGRLAAPPHLLWWPAPSVQLLDVALVLPGAQGTLCQQHRLARLANCPPRH